MSPKIIYQKENNLTQSPEWQKFQETAGREIVRLGEFQGIRLALPILGDYVWFQKAPGKITDDFIAEAQKLKSIFVRLEPGELTSDEVKKYGLKPVGPGSLLSGQASPKATRMLDLSLTEEVLLAQMKPKTRYNIRLAEKKGVKVSTGNNVDAFYEMLVATSGKKTGYYPHEKKYYEDMMRVMGPSTKAKIFTAEHEGEVLAAILVCFSGKVATYLHGGQSEHNRNLMAPYLCQWSAISEAMAKGCEVYDLWGVAESDDPADPWAGITRFKEGFGGQKVVFPGSYDLVLNRLWYNILTLMAKAKHIGRK